MSGFEEQTALLEEYEKWKGEKKVAANDLSPSTFLVERAQKAAYEELEATLGKVKWLEDKLDRIKQTVSTGVTPEFNDEGQGERVRKIVNELPAPDVEW